MQTTKSLFLILLVLTFLSACAKDLTNPSANIQMSDLEGTWKANYESEETDILILKSDGTFKQVFTNTSTNYIFDSDWHDWTLERNTNGSFLLRLQGARYYVEGIAIGEADGRKNPQHPCLDNDCTWGLEPRIFYNPFTAETVEMLDELLLVPQVDSEGNLVLHHIWTSSDRGFALIGGNKEIFYRQRNTEP